MGCWNHLRLVLKIINLIRGHLLLIYEMCLILILFEIIIIYILDLRIIILLINFGRKGLLKLMIVKLRAYLLLLMLLDWSLFI
jgi:hypothetical protein